jgi:putative ABC transport system permease protein
MLKNYILSAVRNFSKARFYSSLNILGLSLGFAAVILIVLYVQDEFGYDRHNLNHRQIYRLESHFSIGEMDDRFAIAPMPLGPAFRLEFPEVLAMARFGKINDLHIRTHDAEYYENGFYYADSTVFDIFTHEFLLGSPKNALTEVNSVVLTESLAKKYFGNENPLGKTLQTGLGHSVSVSAVIRDLPNNSHMRYEALISMVSAARGNLQDFNSFEAVNFWNIGVFTYVMLHPSAEPSAILSRFDAFYDKYMRSVGEQINASFQPVLRPLAEVHLYGKLKADLPAGNRSYLYVFMAVALFILLLAAINYVNMATARSARRAREVGIRKVAGAHRGQLMLQFITESVLMALIALVIAIALVQLFIPEFNVLSGKEISFSILKQPVFFAGITALVLVVGVLSGVYPALFLSSFKPVNVLKGSFASAASGGGSKSGRLRKVLVVFQFWIAFVLIIGTLVVGNQLQFLREKNLGFQKDNLIVLQLQDTAFRNRAQSFKEALLQHPSVEGVTNASGVPGMSGAITVMRIEVEQGWEEQAIMWTQADEHYLKVLGISLVQGRDFDPAMGTDREEAAIINEAFAKKYGWADNPLGKRIHFNFELDGSGGRVLKVIGVAKDFHVNSLHNVIEPYIIMMNTAPRYLMTVRVKENQLPEALTRLNETWNIYAAGRPFDYKILSDQLQTQYESEEKIALIFRLASALTIFIALLGLLGLSSFVAEQRTREIGIRKVLGASVFSLFRLLYTEFAILILLAFVLAVPFAWWRLLVWLESSFVYHTQLNFATFLLAGFMAACAGIVAISFHLIKVVQANPVNTVKYE